MAFVCVEASSFSSQRRFFCSHGQSLFDFDDG
jgi:hypothetical protein